MSDTPDLAVTIQQPPLLLCKADAARALGVSPRFFDDLVLAGLIGKVLMGGLVMFDPEDLRAFVGRAKRDNLNAAPIAALVEKNKPHRGSARSPTANSLPANKIARKLSPASGPP